MSRANTITGLRGYFGSRYFKINFESFATHGTVEFRHHSGTTEYEKIVNWVKLTQAMVERTFKGQVTASGNDNLERFAALVLHKNNSAEMKEVLAFYKARQASLAQAS